MERVGGQLESRRSGTRVIGSLYGDTWVRSADAWRRIRQEKVFPILVPARGRKPVILPGVE